MFYDATKISLSVVISSLPQVGPPNLTAPFALFISVDKNCSQSKVNNGKRHKRVRL